jgi:hypothetical protein
MPIDFATEFSDVKTFYQPRGVSPGLRPSANCED